MPDVQMDYDMMEDMNNAFRNAVAQMDDTIRLMQSIANSLEDGALLGKGGNAFADALRSKLTPAMTRLQDKFDELAGDVYGALVDLRDGDSTAASRFK